MRAALFLDRDGTLHKEKNYLWRSEDVEWTPGVWELCRRANAAGFVIVVVTNQSGIGRGFYSEDDFHALMRWMEEQFRANGTELAAYYFCPHHPKSDDPRYRVECDERKPKPGMLLRAARELDLDLRRSVMVGDRCADIGAANAAGLRTAYLLAGTETAGCSGEYVAVDSLGDVVV